VVLLLPLLFDGRSTEDDRIAALAIPASATLSASPESVSPIATSGAGPTSSRSRRTRTAAATRGSRRTNRASGGALRRIVFGDGRYRVQPFPRPGVD
jgi:hypothetical protein